MFNLYKKFDGYIPSLLPKKAWRFSGVKKIINENADWRSYKPKDEKQNQYGLETMSCVSQSTCRAVASNLNLQIEKGDISQDGIAWLMSNGYLDEDGKINFSDRGLAKMSFTTTNGNIADKVWNTLRTKGLIPESKWSWKDANINDWNEYYCDIPEELLLLGYEFKKRFTIDFEAVDKSEFAQTLYQSPLQVFVYGGYTVSNGIYQYSEAMSNHAIVMYHIDDFNYLNDSYEPFDKRFVKNYPFYSGSSMFTGKKYSYGYTHIIKENIIKENNMIVIKQQGEAGYYAVDVKKGEIHEFGGWDSYIKFLNANWCEPVLEVEEKYSYLKSKFGKDFVKGQRMGLII